MTEQQVKQYVVPGLLLMLVVPIADSFVEIPFELTLLLNGIVIGWLLGVAVLGRAIIKEQAHSFSKENAKRLIRSVRSVVKKKK